MVDRRTITYTLLYVGLLVSAFIAFGALPEAQQANLSHVNGIADLRNLNFTQYVYTSDWDWEGWANELYTPQEIRGGVAGPPQRLTTADHRTAQYATYRLRLALPAGGYYALDMHTSDYSMRLFINGEEAALVGLPGKTREESIPRTLDTVYYFTLEDTDVLELVVNTSNFVHREGATPPSFAVGTATAIGQREHNGMLRLGVIIGCLVMACLHSLAMYVFNPQRVASLLLALSCALLICMTTRPLPFFFPDTYNWFAAIRMEYVVHFAIFAILPLFMQRMFPRLFYKWVLRVFLGICAFCTFATLVSDPIFFTWLMPVFNVSAVAFMAYAFVRLLMAVPSGNWQNWLAFLGFCPLLLFTVNDILRINGIPWLGTYSGLTFTAPVGMVIFVVCYAMALSEEYAEQEVGRLKAMEQMADAKARFAALQTQMNATQNHPSIDDLKLSPREKEVSLLLIDGKSREETADLLKISLGTVNTLCSRIYKKTGVDGLHGLAALLGVEK